MYMMVGIDFKCFPDIKDDQEFVQKLVQEESVFCLPATVSKTSLTNLLILSFNSFFFIKCFCWPNYIRIVLTMKNEKISEACERISEFVYRHYKASDDQHN